MIYVFDTSSLIVLFRNFYPENFPSLWKKFNQSARQGNYLSVKEVKRETDSYHQSDDLKKWASSNKRFFQIPTLDETKFISKIFTDVPHFKGLVNSKNLLSGNPVADPFVIAKAYRWKGCVVSEEKFKENASNIPNVCKKFEIKHKSLREFMKSEGWKF